jgi:hypothetical protein
VVLRQDAFQERSFSRTEKAGEDGDGDHLVQTARGVHDQVDFKKRVRKRSVRLVIRPKANAGLQHSRGLPANILIIQSDMKMSSRSDCQFK